MRRSSTVLVAALLLAACSGSSPADTTAGPGSTVGGSSPGGSTATSPAAAGSSAACTTGEVCPLDVTPTVIQLDGSPTSVTADGSTVWVTEEDDGKLIHVDLAGKAVVSDFDLGQPIVDVAVARDGLWAAIGDYSHHRVVPVDATDGTVGTGVETPAGTAPIRVAAGEGAVWSTIDGTGLLLRIDPATGKEVASITDQPNVRSGGLADLEVGFGSVWVIDTTQGRLLRIDPSSNAIASTTTDLGYQERDQGDGSVAVLAKGPVALAAGSDGPWVAGDVVNTAGENVVGGGALYRIDPATGAATKQVDLPLQPMPAKSGLAITADAAWYLDEGNGYLVRVDLTTGGIATIDLQVIPEGLVVVDGTVWVAAEGIFGPTGLYGVDTAQVAQAYATAMGG